MHRGMPRIRDPGLLVDHRKPPADVPRAGEMIEPRHRTIVDVKGEAFFGLTAERKTDRGLDRSAVGNGDDVLARLFDIDPVDHSAYAIIKIHEALAAGRGLVDIGKPVAADRPAGEECRAIHALPLPEVVRQRRLRAASTQVWEIRRPR